MQKRGWETLAIVFIILALGLSALVVYLARRPVQPAPTSTNTEIIDETGEDGDSVEEGNEDANGDEEPIDDASEIISTSGNIAVSSPRPNDLLCGPIHLVGRARVFEGQFNIRLLDSNGNVLLQENLYSNAPDAGLFGDFDERISFTPPTPPTPGTLQVFDFSARDGSIIDLVEIPVRFTDSSSC